MSRPRILIIYTGGTIGMIEDQATHALRPFDFAHLMDNVPKVKMLEYDIDNHQFETPIDSSDMNASHWQEMARIIARNYDRYDGFVVLHGTDTMAYTASALTFMLQGLSKPVIITGSQLPIGEVRTDGEENLITALQIAAATDPSDSAPMVREVAILFENYLWRGCRATKRSADNFNAFKSNNYPALAKIGLGIDFNHGALARPPRDSRLKLMDAMTDDVVALSVHPALSPRLLEHVLASPGIRGVVMRSYGAGNTPSAPWFIDAVRRAIDRGLVFVNVTQCVSGPVRAHRYVAGDMLDNLGVVSGHDITFEAALTKMMHLMGNHPDNETVRRMMQTPLAGEMTVR